MDFRRWFRHGIFMASLGVLLVVFGLLVITEFPDRLGPWTELLPDLWIPLGICLVAAGEFLLVAVAEDLCPQADPRIVGAMQVTPWVVVLAVVLWVAL